MLVIRANIRAFNLYTELLKVCNLYFMHVYVFTTRRVEKLYKANSTVFVSLFDICKIWVIMSFFSLLYCVIIFSITNWLIQGSNTNKKGYDRVLWSLMLEHSYLLSEF